MATQPETNSCSQQSQGLVSLGPAFRTGIVQKIRSNRSTPQIFPLADSNSFTHDHQTDPHSWLSPPLLIEQTKLIATTLSQLDPEKASLYQSRALTLTENTAALHTKLTEQLSSYRGRSFLIFHSALGHFARTYQLSQKVIQLGDAPPDPKHLREIIRQAQQNKTTAVLIQPQFDDQGARMVAEAIGGRVVIIDPLAEDVLANLKHIADTLTEVFSQTDP